MTGYILIKLLLKLAEIAYPQQSLIGVGILIGGVAALVVLAIIIAFALRMGRVLRRQGYSAYKTTVVLVIVGIVLTALAGNFPVAISSTYNVTLPKYIIYLLRYGAYVVIPLYARYIAKKIVKS